MVSYIPIILFVVVTNAISQALLKQGMIGIGALQVDEFSLGLIFKVAFDLWIIAGLAVMAISMVAHLYILSRVPLTYAFPFIALSYVCVMLIGYFIFNEALNLNHIIGTFLVILGLVFIGIAGEQMNDNNVDTALDEARR